MSAKSQYVELREYAARFSKVTYLDVVEQHKVMYEALEEIAEKLDDEPMSVESKEFALWEIANTALKIYQK